MELARTGQSRRTRKTTGRTGRRALALGLSGLLLAGCVTDSIFGTEDLRIRPDDRPLALPPPAEPVLTAERDPDALPPVYEPLEVPPAGPGPAPAAAPSRPVASSPLPPAAGPTPTTPTVPPSSPAASPAPDPPSVGAAAPTPSVPPGDPAPATGRFWVQVGAFAVPANAERLAGRLATLGPVDVAPITSGGRTLQRVRLGPFTSRQAANQALAQVHAAGYPDAVVMR